MTTTPQAQPHQPHAVTAFAIKVKGTEALIEVQAALDKAYAAGIAFKPELQEAFGAGLEAATDITRLATHVEGTTWSEDADVLLAAAAVLQRVAARHAARILAAIEAHVDAVVANHGLAPESRS